MMELSRSSEEAPLPRFAPAFGDLLTGGQLVAGVALALLHRQNTGEGQLVDVSLLRAGVWAMSHVLTAHAANNPFAAGERPGIRGSTEMGGTLPDHRLRLRLLTHGADTSWCACVQSGGR